MDEFRANPQLENGYTRIANELMIAIVKYPFTAAELRIVWLVIQWTYGYRRKKSYISHGSLAKELRIDIRYVKRKIKKLTLDKVLFKDRTARKNSIGLNKEYTSWQLWKTTLVKDSRPPGSGNQDTAISGLADHPLYYKENNKEN